MIIIQSIFARQILDSRGNPTVEVDVHLSDSSHGRASVPSGASTGQYEAVEKRDGDLSLYLGKSVFQTINGINGEINATLKGKDPFNQSTLDQIMNDLDGTPNKSRLGANGILAVSLAIARACAQSQKLPLYRYLSTLYADKSSASYTLPMPMMNFINGGAHSDAAIDIQEFMLIPVSAKTFSQAIQMGAEVFHTLKKQLSQKGLSTSIGDEGGFAPDLQSSEAVLRALSDAVIAAGYKLKTDFCFALDAAATEFYNTETYRYDLAGANLSLSAKQLVSYYDDLVSCFPIVSIEDGMAEDDFEGWTALNQKLGHKVQIVGDDVFVTNPERLQIGFEQNLANSILIKPNQIGTLSETLATIQMAKQNGYTCVISHRSGETEDTFIADLAVATHSGQIKTGSLSRTDRVAKYNQLLRIEEDLNHHAIFENPFVTFCM